MLNKVTLIGRLGKDPEVKTFEGNSKVANFTLATDEKYRDSQGNIKSQTEWHNIVAWRNQADIAEKYLKKGMLIYIEGKLKHRSWDDKDGIKRYATDIVVDMLRMLEKSNNDYNPEQTKSKDVIEQMESDLPF